MPKRWQALNESLNHWRNQPQLERCHIFRHWMSEIPHHLAALKLTEQESEAVDDISRICDYFCTLAEIKLTPSTNHLNGLVKVTHYYQGKGVYCLGKVVSAQEEAKPSSALVESETLAHFTLLVSSAIAILLCGNGVFMHATQPLNKWQKSLLISLFRALPSNIFQLTTSLSWQTIHQQPEIVGSVYIPHDTPQVTKQFQIDLLERQDRLVQQLCLSPNQPLAQLFHPDWLYQFCFAVKLSQPMQNANCLS